MEAKSLALGLVIGLLVAGLVGALAWQQATYLRKDLHTTQSSLETCTARLESAEANITKLEKALLKCNLTKQQLERNLQEVQQAVNELRKRLERQIESYNKLLERHRSLEQNYTRLANEYTRLKENHTRLLSLYMRLQENYTKLTSQLAELQERYAILEANYTKLLSEHRSLMENYTSLEAKYNATLNNMLYLKELLEKQAAKLQKCEYEMNSYAALVSQLERLGLQHTWDGIKQYPYLLENLIDWQSSLVKQATLEAIKSSSILPKNAFTKIFDWVYNHIEYSRDSPFPILVKTENGYRIELVDDYWRSASETIREGHGDCEDMAILVAAMVKAYGHMKGEDGNPLYNPIIVVLYGPEGGHAFTILPAGRDKIIILDPAGGIITGKVLPIWHQVEPEPVDYAIDTYLEAWSGHKTYTRGCLVFKIKQYWYVSCAKTIDELKAMLKDITYKLYPQP